MAKGDDFEREQCRFLSLWWTGGRRDDVFWRNRRHKTTHVPDAKMQLGDLTAVDTEGVPFVNAFNVEFKRGYSKGKQRYKAMELLSLIDYLPRRGKGDGKTIMVWKGNMWWKAWAQTVRDAEVSSREPMFIFKRDFSVPVVCVRRKVAKEFEDWDGQADFDYLVFSQAFPVKDSLGVFRVGREDILLAREEDFFDWLSPDTVESWLAERHLKKEK